ncbi:hypothetical protein OH773_03330 [Buttiauxella sp. WJP83]|uniref:hypothetical protein n=1 Tax=Buttiauxella sp. WJP83 TaxID=2986951 RepID=UPI0022DDAA56|nr:hypothetical protein [Buttiauxella sp. WJP83]WBM71312.1 hypothetical protein OH773_03330 [Buttiauxella sp. WJP83]
MMSRFNKCFLIFFAFSFTLMFALFISLIFVVSYSLDGVEYSKENFFDYHFLAPPIIKNAPYISDKASYYSQGDDNYGFTRDKVTWEEVSNITSAKVVLEDYLAEQGIQKHSVNNTGDEYLIVSYDHTLSLEIIIHSR